MVRCHQQQSDLRFLSFIESNSHSSSSTPTCCARAQDSTGWASACEVMLKPQRDSGGLHSHLSLSHFLSTCSRPLWGRWEFSERIRRCLPSPHCSLEPREHLPRPAPHLSYRSEVPFPFCSTHSPRPHPSVLPCSPFLFLAVSLAMFQGPLFSLIK